MQKGKVKAIAKAKPKKETKISLPPIKSSFQANPSATTKKATAKKKSGPAVTKIAPPAKKDIGEATDSSSITATALAAAPVTAEITVCCNHYKKPFQTCDGSTTAEIIDEEFSLTFAYPNAKLHLSTYSPSDYSYEDKGLSACPLVTEDPIGVYKDLTPNGVYWVHIEEDSSERDAYLQRQEEYAAERAAERSRADAAADQIEGLRIEKCESCSCIEGNPCLDKYGCKNWEKRFEIATKNGWKGFS